MSTISLISLFTICAILTGVLGAIGGAIAKRYRRVGIPLVLIALSWANLGVSACLYALIFPSLCLGYGRFDKSDGKPSFLGELVHRYFSGSARKEDMIIRSIISVTTWLFVLPVALVNHNLGVYFICGIIVYCVDVAFGAIIPDEGIYELFGRDFLIEETIRYGTLGVCALMVGI
jgi:hypothetical protein